MKRRAGLFSLIAVLASAAIGCGSPSAAKIQEKPAKFDGKSVSLDGTVREMVSIPKTPKYPAVTLYKLTDGAAYEDSIWVLRGTKSSVATMPMLDNAISLEGTVVVEHSDPRVEAYLPFIVESEAEQTIKEDAPGSAHF